MLTLDDHYIFEEIFFILCGLSIIGELFIIISYMSIRKKTNTLYNQVIWLFSTDTIALLVNFYSLLPVREDALSIPCKIVGFIHEFSHICSVFWTSIIAGAIFYSVKNQKKMKSLSTKYVILIILVSCFFPLYPLFTNSYGIYTGFDFDICWLSSDDFETIIVAYWAPVLASCFFNVVCYTGIIIYLKKNHSTGVSKDFGILFLFPLVQMIANSGFLMYTLELLNGGQLTSTVQLVHVVTRGGEGLFNALAYGSSYSIRKDLYKVWCRRRKRSDPNRDSFHDNSSVFLALNRSLSQSSEYL